MENKTGFVHGKSKRPDGSLDSMFTESVEIKENWLEWQKRGLSYTASGYGSKISTHHMVKFRGKWRRVYCCIWSNSGTCYIGDFGGKSGEILIVDIS